MFELQTSFTKTAGTSEGTALPVDGKTIADAFLRRVDLSAHDRVFLYKRDDEFHPMTWAQTYETALGIFTSYGRVGIGKGDRVCIMSNSRPEWSITDIATLCTGAITVPIYQSSSSDDIAYILNHSGAKLIFVEDAAQLAKLPATFKKIGRSIPVVVFSNDFPQIEGVDVTRFDQFSDGGQDGDTRARFRKAAMAVSAEDDASIVYTSGTTGVPKGAILRHSAFTTELRSLVAEVDLNNSDVTLTFLPFAHILGRVESYLPIFSGIVLGFAEGIASIAQDMQKLKPTLMVAVPRVYEKLYAKIQGDIASQSPMKRNIFNWSVKVGRQVARLKAEQRTVPLSLLAKHRVADQLVFSKVREKMGGRLRLSVSGGAPFSPELCEFFHACGIQIFEGYGLTETTAAVTLNFPNAICFGSVGKPVGGTEIRIAEDGEILLRGPVIFRGYFNNPEATADALTSDGWFRSGDIGEINERGFLRITDRKKEIIVTSGGKNVAPQKLENSIKESHFISQAVVIGDKRKFLSVLITLNEPSVKAWAREKGIAFESAADLMTKPEVKELVDGELKRVNASLASYESIKKAHIIPVDFTIETGELTPSLKVKRKVVMQKFEKEIEALYA